MVVRLQCSDLSWTWVYIRANRDSKNQQISCTNFIVRYHDALEQTRPAAFTMTSLGFSVVQQKQHSCRRKSAAMPSSRHRCQVPFILPKMHLLEKDTRGWRGRAPQTSDVGSWMPEGDGSRSGTSTVSCAPPPWTAALLLLWLTALFSTAPPPPAPLWSWGSSTMTSWWMLMNAQISSFPLQKAPPPATPTWTHGSAVISHQPPLKRHLSRETCLLLENTHRSPPSHPPFMVSRRARPTPG